MRKEIIYNSRSLYRDDFRIEAYLFGEGEESVCVVGNVRGNEYQQLYTCSQLIQELKKIEDEGRLIPGKEIMVIPSANPYSMNIGKRFWSIDNTDINRMFPGYTEGETTQRIAGAIFERIKNFKCGIHLPSNYMPGKVMQGISIMKTGLEDPDMARDFGFRYVLLRNPRPYDTTTLNYNWQLWDTKAFSLYVRFSGSINELGAKKAVNGILNFMSMRGVVDHRVHMEYQSRVVDDRDIIHVRAHQAGLVTMDVDVEDEVMKGTILGRITDPVDGDVLEELKAPRDGVVFFIHAGPLLYAHTDTVRLVPLS